MKKVQKTINMVLSNNFYCVIQFTETATRILGKDRNIHQKINLIIFVESAMSVLSLPHICQTAWDLSKKSHFVPDALIFGSDDYCANIG